MEQEELNNKSKRFRFEPWWVIEESFGEVKSLWAKGFRDAWSMLEQVKEGLVE